MRQAGLTGDEIMSVHGHRGGGKCWCGLRSGLILFRLAVTPHQLGVVGPYPVHDAWFLSHMPLEGTGYI
jgi:hypothetical protein